MRLGVWHDWPPPPCLCLPSAACPATATSRTSASAPSPSKPPPPVLSGKGLQCPPSLGPRTRTREEGSGASRPCALPSLRDMTTAPPPSLTLTVFAVPAASPASLIVISIDGEPLPLAAATSPTAVHRPSHSLPSQLHLLFLPPVPVPPHPLPSN